MTISYAIRRIALFLLFIGLPGAAFAYDSPRALIDAIYAPYQAAGSHAALDPFYSARLKGLFAQHAQKLAAEASVHEGDVTAVAATDAGKPFNPFLDADYPLLLDLQISEPMLLGDHAVATVSFHNFDHPSLLSIAMVKEADGWKVDDVSSTGSGNNWMLSWLLAYDPWDVK